MSGPAVLLAGAGGAGPAALLLAIRAGGTPRSRLGVASRLPTRTFFLGRALRRTRSSAVLVARHAATADPTRLGPVLARAGPAIPDGSVSVPGRAISIGATAGGTGSCSAISVARLPSDATALGLLPGGACSVPSPTRFVRFPAIPGGDISADRASSGPVVTRIARVSGMIRVVVVRVVNVRVVRPVRPAVVGVVESVMPVMVPLVMAPPRTGVVIRRAKVERERDLWTMQVDPRAVVPRIVKEGIVEEGVVESLIDVPVLHGRRGRGVLVLAVPPSVRVLVPRAVFTPIFVRVRRILLTSGVGARVLRPLYTLQLRVTARETERKESNDEQ